MFKGLRDRIAEEAKKKFPVGQLNNNSGKQLSDSESKTTGENSTEDLITLSDSPAVVVPHTSPRQFSIGDEDGSTSEQNTPHKQQNDASAGDQPPHNAGQRTHPQGIGSELGFAQEYRPSRSSYVPQSDIESEREDPPTLNLESISKDQLLTIIDLLKARVYKYKNKYSEVVKNYKELRDEKLKIENTLIENQDKGVRRMAELREQCQLEQKAKAHLEANLRIIMEEKDSRISVLETQINLLKEGVQTFQDNDMLNSDSSSGEVPADNNGSIENHSSLKQKIERLEHQSSQAKKTITSQTDQISVLKKQNESLSQQLEEKVKKLYEIQEEHTKLKLDHENIIKSMQIRLEELEKKEEESVMSMAETKRNMHVELELKEKQLKKAEGEAKEFQNNFESEKQKVIELQKKQEAKILKLQHQLESTEKMLEEEKQNLIQEFTRGKTAAITLMQQECDKKLLRIEEEWKVKLQDVQEQLDNSKQSQNENKENRVSTLEEKLRLSEKHMNELQTLKLQLEKENDILKSSLEKLESDFAYTSAKLEKLQAEYMDLKEFNEKESLRYEEKLKKELNDRLQIYEQTEADHHHLREFLKEQLNEKQNVIDDMVHNKNALYNQIDELEKKETDLKKKTEVLENEVKELNSNLHELKVKLEMVSENDQLKEQELSKLTEILEQVKSNESSLIKDLDEHRNIISKLESENHQMNVNMKFLNEESEKIKLELFNGIKEKNFLNDALQDATREFNFLCKSLDQKMEFFSRLVAQYNEIESSLSSIENGDKEIESTILKHANLCGEMSEKITILCKAFKSSQVSKLNCSEIIVKSENVIQKSSTSNQNISILPNLPDKTENKISVTSTSNNNEPTFESKAPEYNDVKQLQNKMNELVIENQKLKKELSALKEFSEIQNIEFAKNITQLHESLNELQEERNNLSLVLQSIETQENEINPESTKSVNSSVKTVVSNNVFGGNPNEMCIEKLNNKVKSEILALSSQTELINQELKKLREQFTFSQLTYSDKVSELNSKLLIRTEQLVSVKNDLDVSLENCKDLQCLLESMKEQLSEKDELIKVSEKQKQDLENKCKVLNDKFLKHELSLKELHVSQLSALKDQTKATIDKLNEEIQKANATLKENEVAFDKKLFDTKNQYEQDLLKLKTDSEHILQCKDLVSKISDSNISFENEFVRSLDTLNVYNSKITNLSSKLNKVVFKLNEKDNLINKHQNQIKNLENRVKSLLEENNDLQNLKSKLQEVSDLFEKSTLALELEKSERKACEEHIIQLKEDHTNVSKQVENINSLTKEEVLNLKSSLNETHSELETIKGAHVKVISNLDKANADLEDLKLKNACFQDLQSKHDLLEKELEITQRCLENEKELSSKEMEGWKILYEKVLANFDDLASKSYENMDKITSNIDVNEIKLKSFESNFINMSSCFKTQTIENFKLKSEIDKIAEINKQLVEEKENTKTNEELLKQEEQKKIKDVTDTDKKLREEIQIKLEDALLKLTAAETQNQLYKHEIVDLQNRLEDSLSNLKNTEGELESTRHKIEVLEVQLRDWDSRYNAALTKLENAEAAAVMSRGKLEEVAKDLKDKNYQLESMVPKEELEICQKSNEYNTKQMNIKLDNLQKQADSLMNEIKQKETLIKTIKNEKANLQSRCDESLKCMKDKLDKAEKNHSTQMDEMRSRVSMLEKETLALKTEKAELLKSQEKLTDLKNVESAIKSELKLKEEELQKLQQKYEVIHKDQVDKIHDFQETTKDKENMILKLKSNIETLNRDHSEKSEDLKKKIKSLEVEREQLMMQAQERVSITEAKYRDDIKALQDKNNKLLQDNNEIEKLKARIDQLVKEGRENNSLLEAAKEDILQLKGKLSKAEDKLSEAQSLKQTFEAELLGKLQVLQAENSSLLGKTNHVESLKAEKEELNEKLKEAEHQVTSITTLENERDSLRNENNSLLKELEVLKSSGMDGSPLQQKYELLKESENNLRVELDEFKSSKGDLETKLSESKTSFENATQSLKQENEKLSKQVAMLEKFHSSDPGSTSVKEYIAVVRGECAAAIKAKEEEMETKLKHLVRDFCIQMDVKDKDCDKMVSEMTEKSQDLEDRLLREHRKEASELRQSLFEKECAFDEMRDHYEETLQKKDKKIKELQTSLRKVSESDPLSGDVLPISEEGSDWDDTWAVPDESVETAAPLENESCKEHLQQIESLQEEVSKCNSEIKELKILLRLSPPESMVNNNNRRDSIQSIPEPTEIEYLKNIIYEYMMGKEPITLAKVIAAVLRFSDSQTQQVIRREEAKHPTTHWLSLT